MLYISLHHIPLFHLTACLSAASIFTVSISCLHHIQVKSNSLQQLWLANCSGLFAAMCELRFYFFFLFYSSTTHSPCNPVGFCCHWIGSGCNKQMRHNHFLRFIRRAPQREKKEWSSITSTVLFLTMSGYGPKTHFLTSAERKCLQSIKGNAVKMLLGEG